MTRKLGLVATPGAPLANRASRAGWRDPRLWAGVAIVAISVVAGARLLATSEDLVSVAVAQGDIAVGASLADVDLRTVEVKVSDQVASTLIGAPHSLDTEAVFVRAVNAGELVPVSALAAAPESGTVQVPISVDPDQIPPSVRAGSVVDIYVLERGAEQHDRAEPALAEVGVVAAPEDSSALVSTGKRQLVVAVPEERAQEFFARLGSAEQPTVTVVRRP